MSILIRERAINPHSRSTGSPPAAGQIPEGVGVAAATVSPPRIVTRAELAPCTCPEHCERDHEND